MSVIVEEAVLVAAGIDFSNLVAGKECCANEKRRKGYTRKIDYLCLLITSLYTHISLQNLSGQKTNAA